MKIILSRKGFDSGYGGYPSLILPDDEMITLPIPSSEDKSFYSEVMTKNGISLKDIMIQLKPSIKSGETIILTNSTTCHLDPDLTFESQKRMDGWRGCFGQIGAAQKVLENNNIQAGDLFIFFGWFNDVEIINGKYTFKKGNGRHSMFGYLQIDKIIYPSNDVVPEWLKSHPHAKGYKRKENQSNCIYIAKERCSFNENIKGYGIFKYNKELDLTKKGMNRTKWDLPDIFQNVSITYHNKNSWQNGYFKSACRGQEFVIEENEMIEKWAINLIEEHSVEKIESLTSN